MKIIKRLARYLENFIGRIVLINKNVIMEGNVLVKGIPFILNKGRFYIGDNVRINSRYSANPIGGNTKCSFIIGKDAILTFKKGVAISNAAICCYDSILVEENVMIGGNTKIYDTDFHSLVYSSRIADADNFIVNKPIRIKQGAFIGAHCIILKGVTIGSFSIVGAGSVVSKDIPDNEIWGGNPARFIRKINLSQF